MPRRGRTVKMTAPPPTGQADAKYHVCSMLDDRMGKLTLKIMLKKNQSVGRD